MCGLTLWQAADAIVQGALAKARELKCKPMTVAVVDAGGAAIVMKREDGSGVLRPDIAFAKAWGPIGMGIGGRAMAKRATDTPAFWAAAQYHLGWSDCAGRRWCLDTERGEGGGFDRDERRSSRQR